MHHNSSTAVSSDHQPAPLQPLLDLITNVHSLLLISTLTVHTFLGKWQTLRSKLITLTKSLTSLSSSPHWSENPLLHTLLPSLLSNLQRLHSLSLQSSSTSFPSGKLLMQSDLDIATSTLTTHITDLNLLLHSGVLNQNAIVLSLPSPTSNNHDITFFIKDLFTRLQIGSTEFKTKSLQSLLQLLTQNSKSSTLVAKHGNVNYLVTLLDSHHHREHALDSISILTSTSIDCRKTVYEQGGLGHLLRILESGSPHLKTQSAIAIESITTDPETAWAISAYNGVQILIESCRSGSSTVQEHITGTITNIAVVEEIRSILVDEGAVTVLLQLLTTGSTTSQEKASNFISLISSDSYYQDVIIQARGLTILIRTVQDSSNPDTIEHCLLALNQLSTVDSVFRYLSSSTPFIIKLGEIVKYGDVILQELSCLLISKLLISDGNKRAIYDCLSSLVKLMELMKPVGLQESVTEAVKSLLTVKSNLKEFVKEEKSMVRLVNMLDPGNEKVVKKELVVMIVAVVLSGGGKEARRRLMSLSADRYLCLLAEMEVAGAKKVLQRLVAGNRFKGIFGRAWKDR